MRRYLNYSFHRYEMQVGCGLIRTDGSYASVQLVLNRICDGRRKEREQHLEAEQGSYDQRSFRCLVFFRRKEQQI